MCSAYVNSEEYAMLLQKYQNLLNDNLNGGYFSFIMNENYLNLIRIIGLLKLLLKYSLYNIVLANVLSIFEK